jgi:hypothetical protein
MTTIDKHTPGPWLMDDEGAVFSHGALVATVNVRQYPGSDVLDWDTAGADGALICGMHDLLEAARQALAVLELEGWECGQLRAAIAKATGTAQ